VLTGVTWLYLKQAQKMDQDEYTYVGCIVEITVAELDTDIDSCQTIIAEISTKNGSRWIYICGGASLGFHSCQIGH